MITPGVFLADFRKEISVFDIFIYINQSILRYRRVAVQF